MYNPFTLVNKMILVTGASSGIGREVAVACSRMGGSIILNGRNEERLKEVYCRLDNSQSQEHKILSVDLTTDDGLKKIVQEIKSINGLVCCAGINDKCLVKFVDREKVNEMFNINLYAPLLLTKELLKQKKISKSASLVFISSISSNYATISNAVYASSKGAINSLVKVLALELSNKKVRVNGIMPGMVNTEMINAYNLTEEQLQEVIKSYPLGRLGEPEDIANAVIYLLSDASNWVTGSNLVVDGGVTLR